jgi:hypothetical protein
VCVQAAPASEEVDGAAGDVNNGLQGHAEVEGHLAGHGLAQIMLAEQLRTLSVCVCVRGGGKETASVQRTRV